MQYSKYISFVAILVFLAWAPGCQGTKEEDVLLKKIFADYETSSRAGVGSSPLKLYYTVNLAKAGFMEDGKIMLAELWEVMSWEDNRFNWDKKTTGVDRLYLPAKDIWTPDMTAYNTWTLKSELTNAVAMHNGTVIWVPRRLYQIPCTRENDEAKCTFVVGSWTYDGSQVDLTAGGEGFDISFLPANPEYKITKNTVVRHEKVYPCCPEKYIDLTYELTISFSKENTVNNTL